MELFQSWYLLAGKSPLGLTREWICTIKWNLHTAFNGEMLMGDPWLEQWVTRSLLQSLAFTHLLLSTNLMGEKRTPQWEGFGPWKTPNPLDWHLQAESGWILPCLASHHMSNTCLTLPLRLCGIQSIAELKFIFRVRTMSYVLVYLICVMISPLQIWILIKNTFW